jgi:hypothetical protein
MNEPTPIEPERPAVSGAVTGYALAGLALGLMLGNFGYQLCAGQHWADAGERTWFQVVALFAVWIYGRLAGPRHND